FENGPTTVSVSGFRPATGEPMTISPSFEYGDKRTAKQASVSINIVTFSERPNSLRERQTASGRTMISIAPCAAESLATAPSVGISRTGNGGDSFCVQK